MSHRVWEGIRRDEYTFGELPETVKEKEALQVYRRLTESSKGLGSAAAIPEADLNDFIAAHRGRDRAESYTVLERESFRQHMSVRPSRVIESEEVQKGRETEAASIVDRVGRRVESSVAAVGHEDDLGAVNLTAAVANETEQVSATSLPRIGGSSGPGR